MKQAFQLDQAVLRGAGTTSTRRYPREMLLGKATSGQTGNVEKSGRMSPTIEQKYAFPKLSETMLLDWLTCTCRRDSDYGESRIASIYYDTPCFDLYAEKRGSDYRKTKVRLRWYDEPRAEQEGDMLISCYLEVKRKYGVTRKKDRVRTEVPYADLRDRPFSSLAVRDAVKSVELLGFASSRLLLPVLIVKYRRFRFVDPVSNARISLDIDIGCPQANGLYFSFSGPIHSDTGVLEVKGPTSELPAVLLPVKSHLTKVSYSKYARCCEKLQQPTGVVL